MTTSPRRIGFAAVTSAVLLISACGTPPQGTRPAAASVLPVTVEIVNGQVKGAGPRVEVSQGQVVRLTVRSDKDDELHVHGYDKSVPLRANEPATVEFPASIPGVFEVELHESDAKLPSLEVR